MKLGVCASLFLEWPLLKALDYFQQLGIQSVEVCAGHIPSAGHIDAEEMLSDPHAADKLLKEFETRSMSIATLNCASNITHPRKEIAEQNQEAFRRCIRIAERLNVNTVVCFSGTPGGSPEDKTPNWVTCPWPDEHLIMLKYQWDDVLIPFWSEMSAFAKEHGVTRIALEMHPGFCVYNPETLLKLRAAVGDSIGVNFDPSHIMWQGADPVRAIELLQGAIFSVHAKDVYVNKDVVLKNGVNDAKHYGDYFNRSWTFRTVGYGHDEKVWRDIISTLRVAGYDGAVNIEHEDLLMSREEGLAKAAKLLSGIIINQPAEKMWWA